MTDTSIDLSTRSLGHDSRILGLIGVGHFLSHFYGLILPPLLLIWREEFDVSFAALGAIITLFALATGIVQIPAGMPVDKIGARPVLVAGLAIEGAAVAAMGFVTSIEGIFVLAALAGVGNSVFHPADYAIMNASLNPRRIGKAFSLHTFSGHLAGAMAPATIVFLVALQDWRFAVTAVGMIGIAVALLIMTQGRILQDDHQEAKRSATADDTAAVTWRASFGLMLSKQMILFFLFFLLASLTSSGVQSFSVVASMEIHQISLATASTALTAFLFASALGILLGGVIADYAGRHEWIAVGAVSISALIFAAAAVWLFTEALLITLFTIAGLAQGMIRPARDMMVRAFAPKGTTGRVFAFVSTGIAMGSAIAPVFFGLIIDLNATIWIFWLLAAFNLMAITTVVAQQRLARTRTPASA